MLFFVLGIFLFLFIVALARGYSVKDVLKMSAPGVKNSFIVIAVLVLIGCLTGLWRSCGTISYFISFGVRVLPPSLFVLSVFLLSGAMSFAIGTSLGVAATAGVILMSIARAGGINPLPVAGAIISGIYIGDRNSPAASSASLVAAVTDTDLNANVRTMLKTSVVPLIVCTAVYTALSFIYPMNSMNSEILTLLDERFTQSAICILPAVLMIVLPFLKVKVKLAMAIDIVISFLIALFVQKISVTDALRSMILGYEADTEALSALLNGGGIKSMLNVCVILAISGSFGGILSGTGLFDRVYDVIDRLSAKVGRFPAVCLLSVVSCMIFCNQTIGIIMVDRLGVRLYTEEEKYLKMIDIEDSVVTLAGLVPWCVACAVPLSTLGVGIGALLFAFFLWLVPLWHWVLLKRGRPVV